MKIGTITAEPGSKAFGFLQATETHGHFPVHAPLHIVNGAEAGPVLAVHAGVSGLEIEAAAILPQLIKQLNPKIVKGTLLLSPLFNTSGFEFEQVNAIWDDKNLNALGRGDADGTVSDMLVDYYYAQVIKLADAVLDMRSGGLTGYYGYAGVYNHGNVAASTELAIALGLPQVLVGQPDDQSMAQAAASARKVVASAWIGGSVIRGHSVIKPRGPRGLTFMAKEKRGAQIDAGEVIGIVRHAHTGETLQEIQAPRAGILLHGGTVWPIVPEDEPLAILGDLINEIPFGSE
jgi:predicted deacylase